MQDHQDSTGDQREHGYPSQRPAPPVTHDEPLRLPKCTSGDRELAAQARNNASDPLGLVLDPKFMATIVTDPIIWSMPELARRR
jgi:hypothetical protein